MTTALMKTPFVVATFMLLGGLFSTADAQTDRRRDLWDGFRDRPATPQQIDRSAGEPPQQRVAQRSPEETQSAPISEASFTREPNHAINATKVAAESTSDEKWWDTEANADADYARPNQPNTDGRGDLIQSSQIIAVVGNEPILAGDLLGRINEVLQPYIGRAPEEELEAKRWELIEQLLPSSIESKMVYLDFVRKMKPEQIDALRASIYTQFDEKQLPELVEKAGVRNVTELEAKMRAVGASLNKTRRLFFEQVAAREVIRRGGETDREISPTDLLAHYRERLDEYKISAKAKWEQLSVNVPPYATEADKQQLKLRLGGMGNAVLDGTPFANVARNHSDGPTADAGGVHDWTEQGSLVSTTLDKHIFSLPLNTMSDILEDETGFHIVRVIERRDAGYVPFTDAQKEIREKIIEEARNEKVQKYLADLKARTYVWNYFEAKTAELDKKQ
ncbi:MAG: peptidylprolyl isomerase, partial [Planctomycetales bacterium]|nr:peptidylprolyl isomerase [Planctomycetales bacterium]